MAAHDPAYYAAHPDEFAQDSTTPTAMRAALQQIAMNRPTVVSAIACTRPTENRPNHEVITNATSPNWSGHVTPTSAAHVDNFVGMTWTVPSVSAAYYPTYSVVWPGLGSGNTTADELVQAGTLQTTAYYSGTSNAGVKAQYFFWYEMFPQESWRTISLGVSPGNSVTVLIGFATSTNTATYDFYNNTKNTFTAVTEKLASGQGFLGHQAEWIVERPSVNGVTTTLSHYGTVSASGCGYGYSGASVVATSANTTAITMLNSSGASLSAPGTMTASGAFTAVRGPGA